MPAAALDAQHYVPSHGDAQPLTLCTALSASLPASLQPVVHAFQATVQHSGFEDFTVEFPWSKCLVPLTAGCSCWPDGPAQLHCWQRSTGHGAAL